MNPHEPERPDEPAAPRRDSADQLPVDVPPEDEAVADETPNGRLIDGVGDDAYGVEPAPRRVITMGRGAFIAMVTFGVLAIVVLGASTIWFALDRGGNSDDDPVVATVNGEEIRRSEYDRAVAENNGADILDGLILERLVANEAKRRNIVVDKAETARQLDELKEQLGGEQAFQIALQQEGLTEEALTRQYELSAMLREMVAGQAQVTDQEIDEQYQASADQFAGVSEAEAKEEIRAGLQRQKENTAARELLDQLQTEARIETNLPGRAQS